jgi:hypothetical protein
LCDATSGRGAGNLIAAPIAAISSDDKQRGGKVA